jgi:hypothetical protein
MLHAEESLIALTLNPREIPRFARNDKINYFSARSEACAAWVAIEKFLRKI